VVDNYIARLPEFVNGNEQLVWRGRYLDTTFLIQSSSEVHYISLCKGKIDQLTTGRQLLRPWTFALKASDEAWLKHWAARPPPGWHDIFAMAKIGEATIEGDLYPMMSNLRYIKELIALPREMGGKRHGE
jgi:hypothetical protein